MKKIFAVYGYNTEDKTLCGCKMHPTEEKAVQWIRNLYADLYRETEGMDNSVTDEEALKKAEEEGLYREDVNEMTFTYDYLEYCVEIGNKERTINAKKYFCLIFL